MIVVPITSTWCADVVRALARLDHDRRILEAAGDQPCAHVLYAQGRALDRAGRAAGC